MPRLGDLAGLTGGAIFETRLTPVRSLQGWRRRARARRAKAPTVKAGDLIVTLDTTELDRQIAMLKALAEAATRQLALVGREATAAGPSAPGRQAHGCLPRAAHRRAGEGGARSCWRASPGPSRSWPGARSARPCRAAWSPSARVPPSRPSAGGDRRSRDRHRATGRCSSACSIRCGAACAQPSPRNSRPTRGARHEDARHQGHRVQRGRRADHGRRRRGLRAVLLITPTAVPCSERYISSTAFALERGGVRADGGRPAIGPRRQGRRRHRQRRHRPRSGTRPPPSPCRDACPRARRRRTARPGAA